MKKQAAYLLVSGGTLPDRSRRADGDLRRFSHDALRDQRTDLCARQPAPSDVLVIIVHHVSRRRVDCRGLYLRCCCASLSCILIIGCERRHSHMVSGCLQASRANSKCEHTVYITDHRVGKLQHTRTAST
jgi:hypothetical protein